jgi:2-dehydropantoate 2-reductase
VATLQNGWGSADVLAEVFDPARLVVGVTYHSATVTGPARVAHTGRGATFVGPYVEGGGLAPTQTVAAVLGGGGIEARVVPAVRPEIWRKLVLNAAALPVSALTGLRAGELAQSGVTLALVDSIAAEAVAVARALGYPIDLAERLERIHAALAGAGMGKPSMLQDVEARRRTEIDVINGAVVERGEAHGVDVRTNRAMVALVKGLERSRAG